MQNSFDKRLKDIFNNIGINIIRIRNEGGMTQSQLAKKAGIGRSTIHAIERGDPCNLTNLIKIADALGVNPEDLFLTKRDREELNYKTKLIIDRLAEVLKLE